MNKVVRMEELCPMIQELLAGGSSVQFTVTGISMRPMLMHQRDQVELTTAPANLHRYDIPLYQRENGSFILHRIVKVEKDGTYTCVGDGQTTLETGVQQEQVVAVVRSFIRKGKKIPCNNKGYRVYARVWTALFPIRPMLLQMIRGMGKVKKKLHKIILRMRKPIGKLLE